MPVMMPSASAWEPTGHHQATTQARQVLSP